MNRQKKQNIFCELKTTGVMPERHIFHLVLQRKSCKKAARVEVNISLAFLHWVGIALHPTFCL